MDPTLREIGLALLILILAVLISRLSGLILAALSRRLTRRTGTILDETVIEAIQAPLGLLIIVIGLEVAVAQLSEIPSDWQDGIDQAFYTLYFLVAYLFLYRLIGGLINWYGKEVASRTDTELDDRFLALFRRLALLALSAVVLITILGRFGVEVSALVTTLGIGSLAFALAAKETLGDMISGFTIMIDQPFAIGDRVEIQDIDTWGDVVDIGLRSTRILTRDNRMVTIPNSVIGKGLVVNYSDPNTVYRVQTHVGVSYGTDLEHAREVMIAAIRAQDWVMKEKSVEALMLEFGDSALTFRVRCWIEHYVETRRIIDKMNTALYYALEEAGIEIPFPQRDVHLVSGVAAEKKQNGRASTTDISRE